MKLFKLFSKLILLVFLGKVDICYFHFDIFVFGCFERSFSLLVLVKTSFDVGLKLLDDKIEVDLNLILWCRK